MNDSYDSVVDFCASEQDFLGWEKRLLHCLSEEFKRVDSDHDIYHSLRVKRLALRLSKGHRVDRDALIASSYLHDIGSNIERFSHIDFAIRRAEQVLPEVGFPLSGIALVLNCIKWHEDYKWNGGYDGRLPIEVLIFQDADRLDAIGAIGVARTFAFGGAHGIPLWIPDNKPVAVYDPDRLSNTSVNHLLEKIVRLEKTLNTELARKIAQERTRFVREFVDRFLQEWRGDQ